MVKLYSRDLGGGGNPPLVILHGMLGSSRNWLTAGVGLASVYRVYALDLRNHGQSRHAEPMSYPDMMQDVVEWLDEQGLSRASFLGHSMGGKVAMLLACRNPDRVERLTVVDIAPKRYFWVAHRSSFAAMNELQLSDLRSRADAELRFEARVPSWSMRKFLTTNLDRDAAGQWRWQINLPALTAAVPVLEDNPLRPDDRYEGPARFIAGGKSDYIELSDHATIRQHFPAADIVTLPASGHSPHMEARDAFVQAVLA